MPAGHDEEGYYQTKFIRFLVSEGLSNDDVGVARAAAIQEIRPGAGFVTGDFVKE